MIYFMVYCSLISTPQPIWNNFSFTSKCNIIIIIMSCRQHGYPKPSLGTPPYRPSLPIGPQGYIPYPHRAVVCRFDLVALHLFGHMRGGGHRGASLMSSYLLLQQCPACLVRLTGIVFVMGGWWLYSCCFVGCCLQDLFRIARNIFL